MQKYEDIKVLKYKNTKIEKYHNKKVEKKKIIFSYLFFPLKKNSNSFLFQMPSSPLEISSIL